MDPLRNVIPEATRLRWPRSRKPSIAVALRPACAVDQEISDVGDRRGSRWSKVRCLIVIGTRPEAIKLVPILLALRSSTLIEPFVVTTGQHRDLVDPVLALAGVTPDADLAIGQPGQTINDVCMATIKGIDQLLVPVGDRSDVRVRVWAQARSRWARLSWAAMASSIGSPLLSQWQMMKDPGRTT